MRNFTLVFSLFLAVFCGAFKSTASHLIGGEIEYESVAPNTYRASCKIYYDCRNTIPPASVQFNLKSPGCNTGVTFPSDLQVISGQVLNPYCASFGNSCSSNALINLRMVTYSSTFTFTPTQLQCNDWILSVKECYRSGFANIPNAINACLYLEAYINTGANGNENVSPMFQPPSDMFVTVNSPATISNLTKEFPKNAPDSLVYTLKRALEDYNTPLTYSANLSFSNPIPSSNGVKLDPNTGMLSFRPNAYVSSINPEDNAYVVIIEAVAYKKINGKMAKVSSAQRSLPVYIVDNAPNLNPEILNATANGQHVLPNSIIPVKAGSTFTMKFETADANPGDSLVTFMPGPAIAGFHFTSRGTSRPTGIITWQAPPVSNDQVLYFPVMVKDNSCPVRGTATHIYGLKVVGSTLGLKEELVSEAKIIAFPNPFKDEVQFRLSPVEKAESLIIYNLLGQEIDQIPLTRSVSEEQIVSWPKATNFPAGTYLVKLIANNKNVKTMKLIKL